MNNCKNSLIRLIQTGFFHIFGSSVINKIIRFLSSLVLVRILSKTEYGVFTYAWNLYSILLLLNGMGMESAALQLCSEHSHNEEYRQRIADYGTRFGLTFDILLVIVLWMAGNCLPLTIPGADKLLSLLCLLPMVSFASSMIGIQLRAKKQNQAYAAFTTANTVILFLSSVICSVLFREKGMVFAHYLANVAAIMIGCLGFNVKLLSRNPTLPKEDRHALRSIAAISVCSSGLSQLLLLADIFVLGIVAPQESILANYKVATMIPAALYFIPQCLMIYVYPYFAEHRSDGVWCMRNYKRLLAALGTGNLLISGTLIAFAPTVINLFFGEIYLDIVPIFRLLCVGYLISGTFRTPAGNLLVTQRKLKFNLMVAILSGSATILLDFLFIRRWGSMGAAFASILIILMTSLLNTGYLIHTFQANSGIPRTGYRKNRSAGKNGGEP